MSIQGYTNIAIPLPCRQHFTYLLPKGSRDSVQLGDRVWVPFGRRYSVGWVVTLNPMLDSVPKKMKALQCLGDPVPIFSEGQLALAHWLSRYYLTSLGEVLAMMSPSLLQKKATRIEHDDMGWVVISEDGKVALNEKRGSEQQLNLLEDLLNLSDQCHTLSSCRTMGYSKSTINACKKRGWLKFRASIDTSIISTKEVDSFVLNQEQQYAADRLLQQLGQFGQFVLDGVTGSGKTEVYCAVIHEVLKQGKQALVLVPEIGLTPQTVKRFVTRCGVSAVVVHSRLTEQQKLDAWMMAKTGIARLVIGTRSALFSPLSELGIIVVDESHDASFKQQSGCSYSARDVAMMWAKMCGIPIVIGTATLSLETMYRCQRGQYQRFSLKKRAVLESLPTIKLVDMRGKKLDGGVEPSLRLAMKHYLDQGKQVLLFLNRRGFSPVLLCHHCAWSAECDRCDTHMVLHQKPSSLRCHQCGKQRVVPEDCPKCGASSWLHVGLGTQRLEELMVRWFPDRRCVRIDRDVISTSRQLDQSLSAIHEGRVDIIVGTQMLAKGHDFAKVAMVAILDCDSHLFNPDFRAVERLAQTLVQVSGRAGRHVVSSQIWVQSHHPEHEVFSVLSAGGYHRWVEGELKKRQLCGLPPFSFMAIVHMHAQKQDRLDQAARALQALISSIADHEGMDVVGPLPSLFPRRKGYWRYTITLSSRTRGILHGALCLLQAKMDNLKACKAIRWRIEIDPIDLA